MMISIPGARYSHSVFSYSNSTFTLSALKHATIKGSTTAACFLEGQTARIAPSVLLEIQLILIFVLTWPRDQDVGVRANGVDLWVPERPNCEAAPPLSTRAAE